MRIDTQSYRNLGGPFVLIWHSDIDTVRIGVRMLTLRLAQVSIRTRLHRPNDRVFILRIALVIKK